MTNAYTTKLITEANRSTNDAQREANSEEFFLLYENYIDSSIKNSSVKEMYGTYINIPPQYRESLYEISDKFCNNGYDVFMDCSISEPRLYICWENAEISKKGRLIAPRKLRDYEPPTYVYKKDR